MTIAPLDVAWFAVLAVLLAVERTGSRWSILPKMILSTGFVLLAMRSDPLMTTYGSWVLMALCLSWIGDLALAFDGDNWFLTGLTAFALAHAAYIAAFADQDPGFGPTIGAAVVMMVVGAVVLRWLLLHLSGRMRVAVIGYVLIIGAMVAVAAGTGRPDIWIPAAAFALSDIAVARNTFVAPGFINKAWGLPLYFAAQYGFALSVGN